MTVTDPSRIRTELREPAISNREQIKTRAGSKRLLGAYYTPSSAADFMADWLIRDDSEHVLEPSFGEGIFLRSVAARAQRRGFRHIRITGVEIDPTALQRAECEGLGGDLRRKDFLGIAPFPVQAVIGNPPYVRLRHLPEDQRGRAMQAAQPALGEPMDPAGSVWMAFVLHAMRFLEPGGRLALVLPYDLTYVRYARPLWNVLRQNFGSLQVIRTHERLFPDILQDVVLLLADHYGARTETVRFQAFERVADLLASRPLVSESLRVDDLIRGERVFLEALLGPDLRRLLRTRIPALTVPARELVTFNIGYVSGDKAFFHPSADSIQTYKLPEQSLRPALTTARAHKRSGLRTSTLNTAGCDRLFLPASHPLTHGEKRYIQHGAQTGVPNRYKCRVRAPWYVVPGVRVPDVMLSVFSERPILMINDAGHVASNSLLCGFSRGATPAEIAARWYTSLTLLQCEMEVHALGGGVMVVVPNEAGNVRLARDVTLSELHLEQIDQRLREGRRAEAYQAGDRGVLVDQLGFSEEEVALIRQGVEVLTHWRTSARRAAG